MSLTSSLYFRLTARSLNLDGDSGDSKSSSHRLLTPKQFLTRTILKAPVPLWMPSCKARGISHAILAQCTEYFDLRAYLLGEMSFREQECHEVSSKQVRKLINQFLISLKNSEILFQNRGTWIVEHKPRIQVVGTSLVIRYVIGP